MFSFFIQFIISLVDISNAKQNRSPNKTLTKELHLGRFRTAKKGPGENLLQKLEITQNKQDDG